MRKPPAKLQKAGVEFDAVDSPTASRLTVGIMALVAEEEGRMISKRTKDALAAAKRRSVQNYKVHKAQGGRVAAAFGHF